MTRAARGAPIAGLLLLTGCQRVELGSYGPAPPGELTPELGAAPGTGATRALGVTPWASAELGPMPGRPGLGEGRLRTFAAPAALEPADAGVAEPPDGGAPDAAPG